MKLVKTLVAALALATIASTAMFAAPKQEGNIKKIKPKKTVTLDVYSQLANYSGLQTGWFADVMLEKFNVKINIYFSKTEVKLLMKLMKIIHLSLECFSF